MNKTILLLSLALITLSSACKKESKSNNAPSTPDGTSTDTNANPPPATTTPPAVSVPTPVPAPAPAPIPTPVVIPVVATGFSINWEVNAASCALRGMNYDTNSSRCVAISSQAACQALNNGSSYVLSYGQGYCDGPMSRGSAQYCALLGASASATTRASCTYIRTKEACDALNNGSLFDVGRNVCVGPAYVPSATTCGAFGAKLDSSTGRCTRVRDAQECQALGGGAMFDSGLRACIGRCENRQTRYLFSEDCQLRNQTL